MSELFQSFQLGTMTLANRIVMAPMTRARSPLGIPNLLNAEYYQQRATAGLIVSEGIPISHEAQGFALIPGLWSYEQLQGWRDVTRHVHQAGGRIFAQLWHVGRLSHHTLQPYGRAPVSASAITANPQSAKSFTYGADGELALLPADTPRALNLHEIAGLIKDYTDAARYAMAAGFDGVEIHAANGYLLEQFLNPHTNQRTDIYGGSIRNRSRLIIEIISDVAAAIGSKRTAIRLSPGSQVFDMPFYPEWPQTYQQLVAELAQFQLAYLHLNDERRDGEAVLSDDYLASLKHHFQGPVILAGGMTKAKAEQLISQQVIDLAAFGKPFIANPDLVARLQQDQPLTTPNSATFYGGMAEGYTDYPTLNERTYA